MTEDIRGCTLQGVPNTHLNYVRGQMQVTRESFCWIDIPNTLLLCWEIVHQHSPDFKSFINLLNTFMPGAGFAVCGNCERVEDRLKSKCYGTLCCGFLLISTSHF